MQVIPDELKTLQKSEVNFFLEKIPNLMKNGDASEFFKLLELYLEGIITKYEFYELIEPMIIPNAEEGMKLMQSLISSRENSRRNNNPLLTPLSEFKVKKQDQISEHYDRFPSDYPVPLCSGRSSMSFAKEVLNDCYFSICVNTANFKSKDLEANKNESLLQKNEEDMYKVDSEILILNLVIDHVKKEKA